MTDLSHSIAQWHRAIDHIVYRVLVMGCGFYHVSLLMWNPHSYAASIGGFNLTVVILLIWSVCSSMIFGIGFKPRRLQWQVLFSPYLSGLILIGFTFVRLV
ncbi:cyd operon protein YbgE [Vibrio sp. PP-XX7]